MKYKSWYVMKSNQTNFGIKSKNKVGNRSRGRPEVSHFNSYYTEL